MSESQSRISRIEEFILSNKKAADEGSGNLPQLEKLKKQTYKDLVERIDYSHYVQSADLHYFISRILFLHFILEYSFFCGQQCIENYLKAYLKFMGQIPPDSHVLADLSKNCVAISSEDHLFIKSPHLEAIVQKYEPFYEMPRYPVQNQRPKGGYASSHPDDIYVLDYFVLKMREILKLAENTRDIFRNSHYSLYLCKERFPQFYDSFYFQNINFEAN